MCAIVWHSSSCELMWHVNAAGYFCDYFLVVCHFDIVIIVVLTFCLATHLSGQMLLTSAATANSAGLFTTAMQCYVNTLMGICVLIHIIYTYL